MRSAGPGTAPSLVSNYHVAQSVRPLAAQIAQMHEVEGRVQGIVREYAQKSLSYLRPVEVARGLVAEAPYVLDIVHIGAHLGELRKDRPGASPRSVCLRPQPMCIS